jgi:uncharacterized repeat protein (TIGR01451 family)
MNSEKRNTKKKIVRVRWLIGSLLTLLLIAVALAPGVVTAQAAADDGPSEGQACYGDIGLDEATYEKYLKRLDSGTLDTMDGLPAAYDARNDGIVTDAKAQACGDCWAFASAGAMESHMLKAGASYTPTADPNLSEQQQVSCNGDMSGCSGGNPTAPRYWESNGPVYETCFPYGASYGTYPGDVPCSAGDDCPQLPYRVTGFYTVPSDLFRESLYVDGPSYFRFDTYDDFEPWFWSASSGDVYVNGVGGDHGGHAVLIIGWDDAKGAYLFKNSWGSGGPEGDGTFWMAYGGHANDLGFQMSNFDLLSLAVDMSIEKSDDPDPVIAGEQLIYDVTVTNNGPNTATNLQVTDVLPSAVTYLVNTGGCVEGPAGTLTCTRAVMAPDESWSFQIVVKVKEDAALPIGTSVLENTASVSADGSDPNPADNTATIYTIVNEEADLRVMKDCKPDGDILAGEEATCTIIVENLGPSTARAVTVVDTYLSDGTFEIGTVTTTVGTCTVTPNPQDGSGEVTCSLGNLAPGDTVTIVAPVTADESQDINDHVTVSSDTPDPDPANNVAEDGVTVVAEADLAITKTDLPDPVVAGTSLSYALTVTNNGPSTATNVVVKDWLPADVVIDALTPSAGSCVAGEPGDPLQPTIWNVDSISMGDSETLTIDVTVLPQTAEGTLLYNDAEVSSADLDLDNSNNVVSADTTVNTEADLSIDKMDFPDPVIAGEQLTYEVSITNNGPSTARDVSLAEELPPEVTFVDASISNGGTCEVLEVPPLTVECQLNDLDPGESVLVFVTVLVDPSVLDGSLIINTATASSSTTDPDEANNTVSEDTTVNAEADLMIEKDINFPTGSASTTIIYFIKVTNLGSSDAQDVVVTDYLPSVTTNGGKQKVEFVFATEGCQYDETTHTVTYNQGVLAAGDVIELEIHIQVSGSPGLITNTVEVSSPTDDPDMTNNTAIKDATVKGSTNRPGGPGGGRGKGPKK